MSKNDLEKSEKSRNTIEITIPSNGVVSESKKGSTSPNTDMSNINSNANDDSKKGQMNNQSDESDSSDDETSKKEQMQSQSEANDSSDNTTSKKEQIIINISHE